MKKVILASLMFLLITVSFSFKKENASKPKLYPALEQYFKSLNAVHPDTAKTFVLHDIENFLIGANSSDKAYSLVFTCPDNAFRSQEAQVILQALYSVNQYKKLNIYSCGEAPTEVDPRLIALLTKVGFVVTPNPNKINDKIGYDVKFSDNMPAITVYPKTYKGITNSKTMAIKLCSKEETGCGDIANASYTEILSHSNAKAIASDQQLENEFTALAVELNSVINQMKSVL